jgi:peptidyl-prolyl cis-trans isomerase D
MGLLEKMRSSSDSTFIQVVMALIILSFIGFYGQPSGDRSGVIATVNGTRILDTEYHRALREELRMVQRTLSDAEQKQLGEQVRQQLIERQVLLQEAKRLGLEVSDSEVARILFASEAFRGENGKFSEEIYLKFLKRQQYTRVDFEETIRENLLRGKLQLLVYSGASLSEPAMREQFLEAETRVDLTVARIRSTAFEKDVQITDEERTKWLAENEALVKETYDRDFERLYKHPEQVKLRLIRLVATEGGPGLEDLRPRLQALRDQIEGGADMAELARRWSEDPSAASGGDLGLRPVAELSIEDSNAIASLTAGTMTRVYTHGNEARLIRVEERHEPKEDTLEEKRNEIADSLIRAERLPVLAAKFAEEQLLPAWKESSAVPTALLEERGLTARATGPIPTSAAGNPFAPPQQLLDAARTAPVGSVLPEVYESGGILYVAQLTERTEPDLKKLDEDQGQIREQMLIARRAEFFQTWVDDLKSRASIE